ncbi:MAG: hypothetical protein ACE5I0_10475, partial [Candidatus Binatia bacterium]
IAFTRSWVLYRKSPVNWDAVLRGLPSRFTIGDLAKAADARGKSLVYLRQIAVRWAKQGKTKRVGRGKYQKIQLEIPGAAARRQRK